MKKKIFGRKFSRDYGSRQALFRALTRALIIHGAIVTTKAKAKAIQPDIDGLVNLAKSADVSKRRRASAIVGNDRETLKLLVEKVAPVFQNRTSGLTRTIALPNRAGDNAEMMRLEWVEKVVMEDEKSKKQKETKKETAKPEKKGIAKLLQKTKKKESIKES